MESELTQKRFYFQWHFLERCNLRCVHCYQDGYESEELRDEQVLRIAELINEALGRWGRLGRVSLTGGEPFLRKDLLFRLLDFFETSPNVYWTGILSNGVLIDEAAADKLKYFSKLREVQISLDGATAESHDAVRGVGVFQKAVSAIRLLKNFGFTVSIMFTLHRKNAGESLAVIDLAESVGVDFLTVERMIPRNKIDMTEFYQPPLELKRIYTSIYERKKELDEAGRLKLRVSRPLWGLLDGKMGGFCPAGFTSLAILHDGTVLPCRRLEIPLGNILTEGLYKIWYTSDVLWKLRNKHQSGDACGVCGMLGKCGGCRAAAYAVTKNYMARDPQCWKDEKS